jgi:hypothetical protein
MVHASVKLAPRLAERARAAAAREGTSVAELLRRGLEQQVAQIEHDPGLDERRARALKAAKGYPGGPPDLAERHDEYLTDTYAP